MTPTEFWLWEHTDAQGRRRKTTWKMTRVDAMARLKDATPVEQSREVRHLPANQQEWHMTGAFRNQTENNKT